MQLLLLVPFLAAIFAFAPGAGGDALSHIASILPLIGTARSADPPDLQERPGLHGGGGRVGRGVGALKAAEARR